MGSNRAGKDKKEKRRRERRGLLGKLRAAAKKDATK
jgi:hypothetical protein